MPLSLNEIRSRAFDFAKEWVGETSEDAEAKSFWDGFFDVFGMRRRRLATFEVPVRKATGNGGFIDLLWRGTLLVEHKSRGKNLDRARGQAFDYFTGLKDRDLPRYVVVSDFARIRLYDLEEPGKGPIEFALSDLPQHVDLFGFISGYQSKAFGAEDPVSVKAAGRLGRLHDLLETSGYKGHTLEVFLVRVLFCLFADDSGIFERGAFRQLLEMRTAEDGADLGLWLAKLFEVLNTPEARRGKKLDEQLAAFPYVNGRLFAEPLAFPDFDADMRETLFSCISLDWSLVNPAIFGSLFQSIMAKEKRRTVGAHYTSETNILKALRPLFLDDLHAEFESVRRGSTRLRAFHDKLARVRVLDPACGCGNFLVIAYRELRVLEIDVLRELHRRETNLALDVLSLVRIDVDQFYGIEISEWPAQIAQVALWLTDHLMNLAVSAEFGHYYARLPLWKSPVIVHGNALDMDWATVADPGTLTHIVGNPPFIGHQYRSADQVDDMQRVWGKAGRAKRLDYVTCWFRKAADFMERSPSVTTALVATNSITQGEQVGTLWQDPPMGKMAIRFAHRTFQWESEAKGKAAVHCVIIGFGLPSPAPRTIYDYATPRSQPQAAPARNINPYLVDGPTALLPSRTRPSGGRPGLFQGSKPWDGGHLLFDDKKKAAFLKVEPGAAGYMRSYVGGDELINGGWRWCLWLKGADPARLAKMPAVMKRLDAVAAARKESPTHAARVLAGQPTLFAQDRQPSVGYLAIPEVSSEARRIIPMAFLDRDVIGSNKLLIGVGATEYDFGILTSAMHMAWVRAVAGRMKSDLSYAPSVYNLFPWPEPTSRQRVAVEVGAGAVLAARAAFPGTPLAALYDSRTMPPDLSKAHAALDRAVDAAYGRRVFRSETERVAFLFERYQAAAAPLVPPTLTGGGGRRRVARQR